MALTPVSTLMERSLAQPSKTDPSEYDTLGRDAAKLAVEASMLLGDAVVEVLKDHDHFNATQIGNVCWVANNECFRKIAEQFQAAQSPHLVFEYALADPTDVIKRLDKTKEPPMKIEGHRDFKLAPSEVLGGPDLEAKADDVLKMAFNVTSFDSARDDVPMQDPLRNLRVMRESLEIIKESSASKLSALQHDHDETIKALTRQVKVAVLQGTPMSDILTLWSSATSYDDAMRLFRKVASVLVQDPETALYMKTAAVTVSDSYGLPNLEHPLAVKVANLVALEREIMVQSRARKIAERDHSYVSDVERSANKQLLDYAKSLRGA